MQGEEKQRFWFEHIATWRSSGQTQRQYCEQHALVYSTLGYWIQRQRQLATKEQLQIVPVRIAPDELNQALLLRGDGAWSLEVPKGTSAHWLAELLRALP